jgi:hypothetical protein
MQSILSRSVRRFGRANGASGVQSRDPLTLDQIRETAPSVFAEGRHQSRSNRYTYIPTSQIVEHLMQSDYGVFAVNQGGSRDEEKRGFTKHMLRFRPLSQVLQVGGTHNEIVLLNSHDGTSAYRLMAGVFRLVCSNGLIVADSLVSDIRVKHSGDILADVARGVDDMRDQLPRIGDRVQAMQAITMSPPEATAFADAALTVKYGTEPAPITAGQLLSVRRADDRPATLWNTLNTVQENVIRGGNHYRRETRDDAGRLTAVQRRTTQPVNSVDGQTSLNRALWTLAEKMAELKTGIPAAAA